MVINSPWFFPYRIPKNWLAHKYMDCGKGSGIPYLVISSPRVSLSLKELASPEQTATGKDVSNPFIVSGLLINQMVIRWTIVFELKHLASPEQTATGKDNPNPFIVSGLLINQMVIECTMVFELKHLTTPVVMAIGKETSHPLFSMIHLSQELTHLEVMRIVFNDHDLMYIWSFVAVKKWCYSRWCFALILASMVFPIAGWKWDVNRIEDSSWFYS